MLPSNIYSKGSFSFEGIQINTRTLQTVCEVAPLHTIGRSYERNTLNKHHCYSALSLCAGFATSKISFKHSQECYQNWKTPWAHGGSLPLLLLEEDDLDDERDEEEEVDVLPEDDVDETDEDLLLLRFRFLFSFPEDKTR